MSVITTLPDEMNKQQVFDHVAAFLLKQNRKSIRGGRCLYRDGNGHACAAGSLITDEEMELILSISAEYNFKNVFVIEHVLPERIKQNMEFVNDLQNIHDSKLTREWKRELFELATLNNLNTSILDEIQ